MFDHGPTLTAHIFRLIDQKIFALRNVFRDYSLQHLILEASPLPEEGGEWGDGNERTGDEAPSRRERSETADGRRYPGDGKGSGGCGENRLQGRDPHGRNRIHDFVVLG